MMIMQSNTNPAKLATISIPVAQCIPVLSDNNLHIVLMTGKPRAFYSSGIDISISFVSSNIFRFNK